MSAAFGDMLSFHAVKRDPDPLVIDIVADIRRINELGRSAVKAGIVILGGGVCKHQIANAMLYVRPLPFLFNPHQSRGLKGEGVEERGRLCGLRQHGPGV